MPMIEVKRPGPGDLRWFGVVVLALFLLVGSILWWRLHAVDAAITTWSLGAGIALLYYAIRPLRIPMYLGWMQLVLPIGLLISHLLLGIIYFAIISPMALVMRAFGRDTLERRFLPAEGSYWSAHDPEDEPARYLRQS
jgi:hypothetical protein